MMPLSPLESTPCAECGRPVEADDRYVMAWNLTEKLTRFSFSLSHEACRARES